MEERGTMTFRPRLRANPVIIKELRSRMRGGRAFAILTAVLVLLALVSFALFRLVAATSGYGGPPLGPQIGQVLFVGLAVLELLMICFVTPALTAGTISGEREMLTYEMLMATPLNPSSILRGKLFSALSYVFLLIFAAVPMSSLVFTFGGVSLRDMIKVLSVLVVLAVTLGVAGTFMSAWLHRTGRATVLTYLLVLALLVGPTAVYIFVAIVRQAQPPGWILIPNPLSAVFSALTPTASGGGLSGALGSLGMILGGRPEVLMGSTSGTAFPRPLYHYTLALYGIGTLVLYALAARLVRPVRRWQLARREVLTAAVLCLLVGGALVAGFVATAPRYEWRAGQAGVGGLLPTPMPSFAVQPAIPARPTPTMVPPPTPTPVPTPVEVSALGVDDEANIYASVIRQLYTVDHTFGDQSPNFPVVYLLRWTDDSVGDPAVPQFEARLLHELVQEGAVAALADLPAEFRWVDNRDEVPLEDPGAQVKGGGAIVTLGNIHPQPDGSVWVSTGLYFGNLGGAGKTYVLHQVNGSWQISGTTGVEWIS
jgi:ABC-2 type transport system permease protein